MKLFLLLKLLNQADTSKMLFGIGVNSLYAKRLFQKDGLNQIFAV